MGEERFSLSDVIREMKHTSIAMGPTIPMWRHALEAAQAKWLERDRQWEKSFRKLSGLAEYADSQIGYTMPGPPDGVRLSDHLRAWAGAPEPLDTEAT